MGHLIIRSAIFLGVCCFLGKLATRKFDWL